jgi:hypothetical protein
MSFRLILSAGAASFLFAAFSLSATSDELNKLEHQQVGNSAQPDVDPNASQGKDPSIVKQEKRQIGNSVHPDVDPNASQGADPSLSAQEKNQIPH